jgi:hypothetical protein
MLTKIIDGVLIFLHEKDAIVYSGIPCSILKQEKCVCPLKTTRGFVDSSN